jgi:hypothetical protein
MSCAVCFDKGLVKICYRDDEQPGQTFDVAICLCETGQRMRRSRSGIGQSPAWPLWRIWTVRNGVDENRILKLEDAYASDEVSAMLGRVLAQPAPVDDIMEAGLTRRKRL